MEIKWICPVWGMDLSNTSAVISQVTAAGYDGLEIGFPVKENEKQTALLGLAKSKGLIVIAQHYDTEGESPEEYLASFTEHLQFLASLDPYFINSQTGKDYFTIPENARILQQAFTIEKQTGVRIIHETHRGKFSYSISGMSEYLRQFPSLRITADLSHYCAVSESFLQSPRQKEWVKQLVSRTDHIHARVGYTQGPQVNDPRAPEWEQALNYHLQWWDAIIAAKAGSGMITITPEFGPAPYMQQMPYSGQPVASPWEVNLFMKQILSSRYILQ